MLQQAMLKLAPVVSFSIWLITPVCVDIMVTKAIKQFSPCSLHQPARCVSPGRHGLMAATAASWGCQ